MLLSKKVLGLSILYLCTYFSIYANQEVINDMWNGEKYLNNSELQYQWATSYIKKLNLKGDEKILDIGCGDGRITAAIAQCLPNGLVIGIDPSESMLQVALDLKDKNQIINLDFTKGDATQLSFKNEFDYVVSFSCFHWISDHFSALQSIERALKPDGKVFLYFAIDHGKDRLDHALNAVINAPKWCQYFCNYSNPCFLNTSNQFTTYAQAAGLVPKRIEHITVDETFPTKEAFAAWISGWLSQLKYIPEYLHKEFLEEIVETYLKNHAPDADNKLHYIGYWVEVELFKSV